jgi:hypothetical protein
VTEAEKYFQKQMKNSEFKKVYEEISEQVNIEWELERIKENILKNMDTKLIVQDIERLQAQFAKSLTP